MGSTVLAFVISCIQIWNISVSTNVIEHFSSYFVLDFKFNVHIEIIQLK